MKHKFTAEGAPLPVESAVVGEPEGDRHLELVGERTRQEDGRDVRLMELDCSDRTIVRRWLGKRVDQSGRSIER